MNAFRNFARKAAQQSPKSGNQGGGVVGGLISVISGLSMIGTGLYAMLYNVDGGHRVVMFNRLTGIQPHIIGEGTHFRIPWIEVPYDFNIRTQPQTLAVATSTRDLQTVNIGVRVLVRPDSNMLPTILQTIGENYAKTVLDSILVETLKSVIAQFNAAELITQREQVSRLIARNLQERSTDFHLLMDDVSITDLTFGQEYRNAVEAKQIAQQDAERAKYIVKQALQDKKSTIIKAEGEARSAELIGLAVAKNPGYLELRRLEAATQIADIVKNGNNTVYLDASSLMQTAIANKK